MPEFKFEDKHPAHNPSGFTVTNEQPEIFEQLLSFRKRFHKVCAIASGGEIAYMNLLPRATRLLAVDHSYRALCSFWLKGAVMEQMGAQAFKDLITKGTWNDFAKLAKPHFDAMPEAVQKGARMHGSVYVPAGGWNCPIATSDWNYLRNEWNHADVTLLEESIKRMAKMTLIHGDLTDAASEGPFDLLYISNMLEHQGRGNKKFTLAEFCKLVKPGGYLLATGGDYQGRFQHKDWPLVKVIKGARNYTWDHRLHQHVPSAQSAELGAEK